jgi:hypothetical protein
LKIVTDVALGVSSPFGTIANTTYRFDVFAGEASLIAGYDDFPVDELDAQLWGYARGVLVVVRVLDKFKNKVCVFRVQLGRKAEGSKVRTPRSSDFQVWCSPGQCSLHILAHGDDCLLRLGIGVGQLQSMVLADRSDVIHWREQKGG